MKRATVFALLLIASPLMATNYTVKSGGGGSFTTLGACATQMSTNGPSVSDTCTVFAGTYNENVTVPAGSSGNYKTFNVNASDVVSVYSFHLNSHNKLIGNCATPAYAPVSGGTVPAPGSCGFNLTGGASPLTAPCVTFTDQSTDIFIENNVMSGCGSGGSATIINGLTTNGLTDVVIENNSFSYGCGSAASPDNCSAIYTSGSEWVVQNNDMGHFGLAIQAYGQFIAVRNNTFHNMNESECGPQSGNCHLDIIYAERSNTSAPYEVQNQLWEGNLAYNNTGGDAKGLWLASDNPSGCGTSCFNVIGRYNILSNLGSTGAAQTSGFQFAKYYNNDCLNTGVSSQGTNATVCDYLDDTSPGGAFINNLLYFPLSVLSSWGWYGYSLNSSGDATGFTAGANLLYCTSTPCNVQTLRNGSSAFAWTSDTPVIASNILGTSDPLANYSTGNYNLASGSQALNAGTYLTTVASGDSGSGTSLVVTDSTFFQAGLGLTSLGVQADCISVTTVGNHVCITANNTSTNTLTLASGITRSVGDHIWLYSDSSGTVRLTGSAPYIGALPASGSSFSCSPNPIPANHSGNIALTCTVSSGLTWTGSTVFTASAPATLVSYSNVNSTTETVTVTTSGSTGTSTITDTTDSVSSSVSVATETFTISPSSGAPGSGGCSTACQGTITFTGSNSIWSVSALTLSLSGSGCTGDSIGSPTITSNTAATATLTWGSSACTITITDTSTGATASFTVASVSLPTVTTGTIGTITGATAIVSGSTYTCTGGCSTVTAVGVACGTSTNPTSSCGTATVASPFAVAITGQPANTTVYVRAYATNSAGTAYGSNVSYTTPVISYTTGAGGSNTSGTQTFSYTATTLGDAVLMAVFCNSGGTIPSSATLSASGWTITQLGTVTGNGSGAGVLFGAIAPNTSSATFTAGFGAVSCTSFFGYRVDEFSGNNQAGGSTTFPVTASSGASTGGCNQSAAAINPTSSNSAVYMMCFDSATGAVAPWLLGGEDGFGGDYSEYQVYQVSGSQTPDFSGTTGAYSVLGTSIAPLSTTTAPVNSIIIGYNNIGFVGGNAGLQAGEP